MVIRVTDKAASIFLVAIVVAFVTLFFRVSYMLIWGG